MAYVTRDIEDEEEQKQGAPVIGGGAPTMRAGQPMSSTGQPAPQQTPQQQKGTGFTNLQSWLDAGKGRHKSIAEKGSDLLGEETRTFEGAVKPIEDASSNFTTYGSLWDAGADVDKAVASGDTSGIEKNINQKYEGPREVNYDPNARQNLWDTEALTSTDTAGSVLGKEELNRGGYSAGAQALDRVLFGADSASQKAAGDVKRDKTEFTNDVKDRTGKAMEKVGTLDTAAKTANDTNRAKLGEYGGKIVSDIDRRVSEAQQREKDIQALLAGDPTKYVGEDGLIHTLAGGETASTLQGGGATRENMVTDKESAGLAALNRLIGSATVQKTGTYQDPRQSVTKDPNYAPPLPSRGGYDPRVGTVVSMLDGDINDPSTPKGAYQQAYMAAMQDGSLPANPSAAQVKDFLDKFQREHPNIRLPTGEEAEAWEKSRGSPGQGGDQNAETGNEVIATPAGLMKRKDWEAFQRAMNPGGWEAIDTVQGGVDQALKILGGLGG